jgi:hypothetical protein
MPRRSGNKWTINETLAVQREHELLNMSTKQIAEKHERSEESILFKLYEIMIYENGYNNMVSYTTNSLSKGQHCVFSEY